MDFSEMMFAKWMTFLTSLICAIYGMSPSEINFDSFTGGTTSALGGNDTAEKLAASKDSGLRPLLSHFENLLTDYVVSELDNDFCFRWTGLDVEDQDKKYELRKTLLTLNELRAEEGYGKIDGALGDAPVEASLLNAWMQLQSAQQPEEGEEPPNDDDKEDDNLKKSLSLQDLNDSVHQSATSPYNDLPKPSLAQIEAGNYRKGHLKIAGMDITIENPKGSERKGVGSDGKPWSVTMKDHYGYFNRTLGKDGDHVDVFINPDVPNDFNGDVFVVNQIAQDSGGFDEHKVMLGYGSIGEAKACYLRNYHSGWDGIGHIATLSTDEFKNWLYNGDTKKLVKSFDTLRKANSHHDTFGRFVPVDVEAVPLAPNGKPSNLNAMQWAQVRTPAFKKWFGDWEQTHQAPVPIVGLTGNEIQGTTPSEARKDAKAFIGKLINALVEETGADTLHNGRTGFDIRLTPKGVVLMCQHFSGHKVKQLYTAIRSLRATNSHWQNVVAHGYKRPQYIQI